MKNDKRFPPMLAEIKKARDALEWDSISYFALLDCRELINEMLRYHEAIRSTAVSAERAEQELIQRKLDNATVQ